LDVARVKLASESRIHMVHEHALMGIPFTPIEKPPFQHGLSSSVDFFAITSGPEWDYAVRDGKVVLFASPQLEGTRIYLYCRVGCRARMGPPAPAPSGWAPGALRPGGAALWCTILGAPHPPAYASSSGFSAGTSSMKLEGIPLPLRKVWE